MKKILNKKYILSLTFVFLLLWSISMTYLSMNNINVIHLVQSQLKVSEPELLANYERDYLFIRDFLNTYYKIEKNVQIEDKILKINKIYPEEETFLNKYSKILNYFYSSKGTQSYTLNRIVRDHKSGEYTGYLFVHQNLNTDKSQKFLVKVKIQLSLQSLLDKNSLSISQFSEQILTVPPNELKKKIIMAKANTTSGVRLPCKSTSVSSLSKKSSVEMRLETDSRGIQFYPNSNFSDEASFKVKCGSRHFDVKLQKDDSKLTLFQNFELSDGVVIFRKLSHKEKIEKILKEQFGLTNITIDR